MTIIKKYLQILNLQEKNKILFIFLLMIISMIVEVIGVGLIIPIITLLTKPEKIYGEPNFKVILEFLGNPSQSDLIIYIMILFLCIYLLKNLYLGFFIWVKLRFTKNLKVSLSKKLFSIYLKQPYEFFLKTNSAQIMRNTTSEVENCVNMLIDFINLMTEILVFIAIISLIIFMEPIGSTIMIVSLGLFAYSYYFFTKNKIYDWGKKRQYYSSETTKNLQQSIGSIKEIKLLGCEDHFVKNYSKNYTPMMMYNQLNALVAQLPRLWLEVLAVLGLTIIVIINVMKEQQVSEIIPILALFSVAAFRLLPSTGRMVTSFQQLKFNRPSLDLINEEFKRKILINKDKLNNQNFKNRINFDNVSYSYSGSNIRVLEDINLQIQKGEYIGFVGPSGSGKTTLIDLLLGFFDTNRGKITIDEKIINIDKYNWQRQIGYVPQNIYIGDETLKSNIALGVEEKLVNHENLKRSIEDAQLNELVANLPEGLETKLGERGARLSGGQKQRIGIARALYKNPEILVLDEATSALDIETEKQVMKSIYSLQKKKTVLIISHRLSTVKECDRIYVLEKGKIVNQGKPKNILSYKEFNLKK